MFAGLAVANYSRVSKGKIDPMLIYQVRPRKFRFKMAGDIRIELPVSAEIRFHLQPLQSFGMAAGGGRTAVRSVVATVNFDLNTGFYEFESKEPLRPLEVVIEEPPLRVCSLNGNVLTLTETFDSWETLHGTIESVYFGLPMLLNATFADPPIVERVDGTIGGHEFRWELSKWNMKSQTTTQDLQENRVGQAWLRMPLLANHSRRRLVAALHYFHVACRLDRKGGTPGEFLPEVLLNLAKTLEALFPPHGDGTSLDAARSGLKQLGYTVENIERDFTPAIALRNQVGVGHVFVALLTRDQLEVLHAYTERAEFAWRKMLDRAIARIEAGDFDVAPYELQQAPDNVVRIIEKLKANAPLDKAAEMKDREDRLPALRLPPSESDQPMGAEMTGDRQLSDREINNATFVGLARTLIKITVMLIESGALIRETAIRDLKDFQKTRGDSPSDQMTVMWVGQVLEILAADPSRPPPADVIDLYSKG